MSDFWTHALAEHEHRVLVTLLAQGLRLDEARDVAQEAWLRVMEAHAGGKLERIELPGLVLRQAQYVVADRRRAARLRPEAALPETLVASESAAGPSEARELVEVVEGALAGASTRARGVFFAALASPEVGHRELAAREGLSLQRFRQVLCEVRARLRRSLRGDA